MKIFNFLLLYLVFFSTYGQKIYTLQDVDAPPLLSECKDENDLKDCFQTGLQTYIQQKIDINNLIPEGNGVAYAQFIINEEGKIESVRIRSRKKALSKETERLVKKIKFLSPAYINGAAVAMKYVLPVHFQTTHFRSYNDFFQSDMAPKEFTRLEKITNPPNISDCQRLECLHQIFTGDLKSYLLQRNFKTQEIKDLGYTFLITAEKKIQNIVVASPNSKIREAVENYLQQIQINKPATNEEGKATTIRFTYTARNL